MPNIVTDTDVLIVGAGPVGLFLANEMRSPRPEMAARRNPLRAVGTLQSPRHLSPNT